MNEWISVYERVPSIDTVVLVAADGFRYPVPASIAFISNNGEVNWRVWPQTEHFLPDILMNNAITHWRQMPTMPESG